jgi:hypothetical protein
MANTQTNLEGGAKPTDWTKLEGWTGGINPNGMYNNSINTTKVLCKDGQFDFESSSPNAKYDNSKTCRNNGGIAETFKKVLCNDGSTQNVGSNPLGGRVDMPCKNNGGVSKNQPVADAPKEVAYSSVNLSSEEKFYESLGLKDKGGLTLPLKSKGRLLVAVVLVAGYFAYKKFKK